MKCPCTICNNNDQQQEIKIKCYGERIHAQASGRTKGKHDPQLLFRLRKFLLPGFPYGGVLYEVILTIVTANEVNSCSRTESKEQATKRVTPVSPRAGNRK